MIRTAVISDVRLYRDGLVELLRRDQRLEVVGAWRDLSGLRQGTAEREPHVILVDFRAADAIETARSIYEVYMEPRVVALGLLETTRDILTCAEVGMAGYASRECSISKLVAIVTAAARDELLCPPRVAGALLRRVAILSSRQSPPHEAPYLTPRELDVAELINEGLTNQEIGVRLGIETTTVKVHVHNLLEKLGVHHRGEAASILRRTGTLSPGSSTAHAPGRYEPGAIAAEGQRDGAARSPFGKRPESTAGRATRGRRSR